MRIIISSCKSEEADKIADTLIEERLIASCNIIRGITTKLRWQGKPLTQTEDLLIMRTRDELVWKLERRMTEINSFETPEIAAIDVQEWNEKYLKWIYETTEGA